MLASSMPACSELPLWPHMVISLPWSKCIIRSGCSVVMAFSMAVRVAAPASRSTTVQPWSIAFCLALAAHTFEPRVV